jgi:hypothetical protein
VFNTFVFGDGFEDISSDLASTTPGADVISDTVVTPFGDFAIPTTFDAVAAESVSAFPSDGYDLVPDSGSTEVLTAINGLPPFDVAVQGYQLFDVDNISGDVVGTFDADETTTSHTFGIHTQALLVTSDGTATPGTGAGDVPPVGSVFDISSYGDSGFETVYSDLASTTPGADVISETLVTPFGDFAMPTTFDAAAGLAADSFLMLP